MQVVLLRHQDLVSILRREIDLVSQHGEEEGPVRTPHDSSHGRLF